MTVVHEFNGSRLDDSQLLLGEGPSFDPISNSLIWFNILEKEMHELNIETGVKSVHQLPFMASVYAAIDTERQLIASEDGLFIRDRSTGALELHVEFEPGKPDNRSNDGRMHPSGALWIGTMSKTAEKDAGAIYHISKGVVTELFDKITIPNGICFTADGTRGYFVDTMTNHYMTVKLDAHTGLPVGKIELFMDQSETGSGCDGAVCDADGYIWNARWGGSAIYRYAPDGTIDAQYNVPPGQPTCPVFFGKELNRIAFTSAYEHMDDEKRAANANNGQTFDLGVAVRGVQDAAYKL
jgi:sugar lactone lactonase YvrE